MTMIIYIFTYLHYGKSVYLPAKAVLTSPSTLRMLDVGDYKTELATGLTHCWDIAHKSIIKAQAHQKKYCDCHMHARTSTIQAGDRVILTSYTN